MIPRREMIKVSKLTQNLNKKQKDLLLRVIAAAVMLIILFILPLEGYPVLRFALFMIPYLTVGHDILRKSWKGIRNGQVFDECFLMAVATIGAMILGEYPEGVAVMLFYQIGELFQSIAVGRSRRSISELMDIRPDYANLEQDGEVEKVDPDDVEVGSIIVIRPGEKVPIDGVVVEGASSLNTSALTGESLPRDVGPGDDIISGSVNMSGLLRVETTKEFDESTASKILELVENAGERKARSEQFITKFARVYTPAVCIGALALAVLGPVVNILAFGRASDWALWKDWIYRALTFLVISCPCAIVVSVPLSFFGGIGGASSQGILIKGSNFMETWSTRPGPLRRAISKSLLSTTGEMSGWKPRGSWSWRRLRRATPRTRSQRASRERMKPAGRRSMSAAFRMCVRSAAKALSRWWTACRSRRATSS